MKKQCQNCAYYNVYFEGECLAILRQTGLTVIVKPHKNRGNCKYYRQRVER